MSLARRVFGGGLGRVLGTTLIVASLPLYVSYENRPVLDRWSHAYAVLLLVALVAWGIHIGHWWLRRATEDRTRSAPAAILDASVLCLGAGYLISAVSSPSDAARLLDLNLFGSTNPASALLEGLALAGLLLWAGAVAILETANLSRNLALAGASVLALGSLGELGLRLKTLVHPETQGFPTHSTRIWNERYVKLNRGGYRDTEHSLRKGSGVRRLAIVGDSYAFGAGIEDPADRFGEQLGAVLADATESQWEVINVSRGDSHTLDHLRFLEEALRFEPELLVLLYVFNDVDYLVSLTPRNVVSEAPTNVFARLHPLRVAFQNSYLFQELYVRARLIGFRLGPTPTRSDPYADPGVLGRHLDDLALFVARAERAGTDVVVVPYDIGIAAQPDTSARYSRFLAAGRERQLPFCDLANAFRGRTFAELAVNVLDAHPNALANRLAARAALGCVLETPEAGASGDDHPRSSRSAKWRSERARAQASFPRVSSSRARSRPRRSRWVGSVSTRAANSRATGQGLPSARWGRSAGTWSREAGYMPLAPASRSAASAASRACARGATRASRG
jgi:hypothetical protein